MMHMFETCDDKHQMNCDAHVWDAKWCTCLRRQTPNDTHVWDDKHQMTHMFETANAKWCTCLRRQASILQI